MFLLFVSDHPPFVFSSSDLASSVTFPAGEGKTSSFESSYSCFYLIVVHRLTSTEPRDYRVVFGYNKRTASKDAVLFIFAKEKPSVTLGLIIYDYYA